MKHLFRIILLLLCATILLASCGEHDSPVSSEPAESKTEPAASSEASEPPAEKSAPEETSPEESIPDGSSTEPRPPFPEESETTLELLLNIPLGDDSPLHLSALLEPTSEGYRGLCLFGWILADAHGVLYTLPHLTGMEIANLSENRVLASLAEFFLHDQPEYILSSVFTDDYLYFSLANNRIFSCDLKTGELTEYPALKQMNAENGGHDTFTLCKIDGQVLAKNIHESYYALTGERVIGLHPMYVSYDKIQTTVTLHGKYLRFAPRWSKAEYTELSNGNLLETWYTTPAANGTPYTEMYYTVYDPDGNILSSFCRRFRIDLNTPIPCHLVFDDIIVEKYPLREIFVGDMAFKNVVSESVTVGDDGTAYEVVTYEDRVEIYKIHAGYTPLPPA